MKLVMVIKNQKREIKPDRIHKKLQFLTFLNYRLRKSEKSLETLLLQ